MNRSLWNRAAMCGLLTLGLAAPAVFAQDNTAGDETAEAQPWAPSWSDGEIGRVAEMLSGTWMTTGPIATLEGGDEIPAVMRIKPVPVQGMSNVLYAEAARKDSQYAPYFQAIFQLYRFEDQLRLRTYEFKFDEPTGSTVGWRSANAMIGAWAAPELFPTISRDDLYATLDVNVNASGDGFEGSTPYPYPTGARGAVQMTSRIELTQTGLLTADTGYAADGSVAWGGGTGYTWRRAAGETGVTVSSLGEGLVVIDWGIDGARPGDDVPVVGPGDRLHAHYTGFTSDGYRFQSSYDRGQPFPVNIPSPGGLIEGWNRGLPGIAQGARRRLLIPAPLAYGERGSPRAGIPANSTLFFDVEAMLVEKPDAATSEGATDDAAE